MRAIRYVRLVLGSLLLCLGLAAAQNPEGDATIIGVAKSTPDFSALLNAIDIAGLKDTLQSTGPFTVFAPTNEAFAKLSDAQLKALLADRAALRRVLSYHIVPGSFTTSDITADMENFETLAGAKLPITQQGVGDATVTAVNIAASNGVVFAIDTVLTPPGQAAVPEQEEANPLYSSSAKASERYELAEVGGSGISGSVLVAEYADERTIVTVSLSGMTLGSEYPAALYAGSCDQLTGNPVADLEPVASSLGISTTVTDLSYESLTGGDYALALRDAADDNNDDNNSVVACGEVGQ